MAGDKTEDKSRSQRLMDVEIASIKSKEYNPEIIALKESGLPQATSKLFPDVVKPKRAN